MMKLKTLLGCLLIVATLFSVSVSFNATLAASPSDISISMSPENPNPYEVVTITLNSYAYNLDTVLITWLVNNKGTLSGIGKKNFTLTAGAVGSETTVTARIFFPDGVTETRVRIKPAVMTLLWQATDSYVPPFYRGKALATADSEVKVVALPEIREGGSVINPRNMTYSWKKDFTNDQSASGYGKNYYVYTNDYLDDANNVSVAVSTLDGSASSQAEINVNTTPPEISFYKKDPAMGIMWDNTLVNGHRIVGEEMLVASPYFISPKEIRTPTLLFSWTINDLPIKILGTKRNLLPLRVEAGVTGKSIIKLQIDNQYKVFQTASKQINVEF